MITAATAAEADVGGSTLAIGSELEGRYRVEAVIGRGGMGAVYRAYDKELERPVAIKVHHRAMGERLRREAVAMAKLAHPNVIPVFEVGDGFVVMELVDGRTLRAWLGERPRSRRERLAMLLAAGAGLVAAHDAGLIHRDFKPENVLVGRDDRPRVGDFGLVVAEGSPSLDGTDTIPDPPVNASGDTLPAPVMQTGPLSTPLTVAGTVLGTPAYMAPEQARGQAIDARADQLAFAIVAWEVLAGERPFDGDTFADVIAAIDNGERRGANRIPRAIRDVLDRGLAARPAARYPTLRALLAALRGASTALRRRLAGGGVFVAGLVALVIYATRGKPDCARAGDDLAALIGDQLVERVRAVDPAAAQHIADGIARYRKNLVAGAVSVCTAQRDGKMPADTAARARRCLAIAARASARILAPRAATAADLPTFQLEVDTLPEVGPCADPVALAAMPDIPDDVVDTYVAMRADLEATRTDLAVGRDTGARDVIAAAERSDIADNPSIKALALIARAQLANHADDRASERKALEEAYAVARSADDLPLASEAVVALLVAADDAKDTVALHTWVEIAIADAMRDEKRAPILAANLYMFAASVVAHGEGHERATAWSGRSLALYGDARVYGRVSALSVAGEVACVDGHYDTCFGYHDQAIALARQLLGPDSLEVANLIANAALDYNDAGRSVDAVALVHDADRILHLSPSATLSRATMLVNLGATLRGAGPAEHVRARQLLVEAQDIVIAKGGERYPLLVDIGLDVALLDADDGHLDDAATRLERTLAFAEQLKDDTQISILHYDIAYNALLRGKLADARAAVDRSLDIRARVMTNTEEHAKSLILSARIANAAGDPKTAKARATEALALSVLREPVDDRAWAMLELGKAHKALHEPLDLVELHAAHAIMVRSNDDRLPELDELLR